MRKVKIKRRWNGRDVDVLQIVCKIISLIVMGEDCRNRRRVNRNGHDGNQNGDEQYAEALLDELVL